jgi:hypothetical protein
VTFTDPTDFVEASRSANYGLQKAGTDGLLLATDAVVRPLGVSWSGNTATLYLSSPLTEDVYRLTVDDAITTVTGVPLDGDQNGTAGGDWSGDFVVGALSTSLATMGGNTIDVEFGGWGTGQLVQGPNNAFDGLGRLHVGGSDYNPTYFSSAEAYEFQPC